jgi:hypothetical protein
MFKNRLPPWQRCNAFAVQVCRLVACLLATVLACSGCITRPPLPPVDLQAEGWKVRQGQAVWKRNREAPELAGELLVASRPGHSLVQFTKAPFTILSGRQTPQSWEMRVPMRNERHAGPGTAPKRLVWFHLPRVLDGARVARPWTWELRQDGTWRLGNERTREYIEGYLLE